MKKTRTIEEYDLAMSLLSNNSIKNVSDMMNIPWSTIRNWKNGRSICHDKRFENSKKSSLISIIRNLDYDNMATLLNNSTSICDMLKKFNLDYTKPYYINAMRDQVDVLGLDLSILDINRKNNKNIGFIPNEEMLIANSNIDRSTVRRRILRDNLLEYKCSECSIIDEYNGKKISLQLDHINGKRNDHRLVNLRWLCPNCHSQMDTSFGRNRK